MYALLLCAILSVHLVKAGLPGSLGIKELGLGENVGNDRETRTNVNRESYLSTRGTVAGLAYRYGEYEGMRGGTTFAGKITSKITYYNGETYKFTPTYQSEKYQPYNTIDGKYTCKTNGTYIFSFSLFGKFLDRRSYRSMYGELMKDGVMVTRIKGEVMYFTSGYTMSLQGATTVSLQCAKGEKVWVRGGVFSGIYRDETRIDRGYFSAFFLSP